MRRPPSFPLIEPLESRIAPASVSSLVLGLHSSVNDKLTFLVQNPTTGQIYTNGVSNGKTGSKEVVLQFIQASDVTDTMFPLTAAQQAADQQIANLVNDNPNVFFITVGPHEAIQIPTNGTPDQLVNVTSGTVVAFFVDNNSATSNLSAPTPADYVLSTELSGLSLGTKVNVAIGTDVHGDVVTNYNSSLGEVVGGALLNNTITSISFSGNITGAFISGGNVSKFSAGAVHEMLTGSAALNYSFDFDGGLGMTNSVLTGLTFITPKATYSNLTEPPAGTAGPSLNNVLINSSTLIQLGNGGAGAAGGSLNGLTVQDMSITNSYPQSDGTTLYDPSSISVLAGDGGAGISGKTNGGAGGSISNVIFNGPPTSASNVAPNQLILLHGGDGGAAFGSAKGGAGGAVKSVYVGYLTASTTNPSATTLQNDVIVQGGNGGSGGVAGAGGALANINILTSTSHQPGSELTLTGGTFSAGNAYEVDNGFGAALVTGVISTTGSLINAGAAFGQGLVGSTVEDLSNSLTTTITAVNASGTAVTLASNIFSANDSFQIENSSGVAILTGSITSSGLLTNAGIAFGQGLIGDTVLNDTTSATANVTGISAHPELALLGGIGAASSTSGKGGAGGSIANSTVSDIALPPFQNSGSLPDDSGATSPTSVIELIQAGAGGAASAAGPGGAGGSVSNLTLEGFNFQVIAGDGGNGISAGGAGGGVGNLTVYGSAGALPGDDFHAQSLVVVTGAGGNGQTGRGGNGGSIANLNVNSADFVQSVTVQGGDLNGATVNGLQLATGAGGSAGRGAGGAGGSISGVKIIESDFLTVTHPVGSSGTASISTGTGGNALVSGGKGGAGGSINNVILSGASLVVQGVTAGAGGNGGMGSAAGRGGAGGKISSVAISTTEGIYIDQSQTTASTGYLYDPTANFNTDDVQTGDTVENTLTQATTTVTGISADGTELSLAANIFAVNDPYNIDGYIGVASDPATPASTADYQQDILTDANADFITEGVQPGDTVIDAAATPFSGSISATATVTAVLSATQLELSSDISRGPAVDINNNPVSGDWYAIIDPGLSTANFTGGAGGAGTGNGAGGAGGGIVNSSVQTLGSINFIGGAGGAGGASAAAGAGGTLNGDGAFSTYGSSLLQAGNAGSSGAKAGAGGSIVGANIQALYSVTMIAGNGAFGGAGGSVTSSGFYGASNGGGGYVAPIGNVTVQSGSGGSSSTGHGGAGGSISSITGFISSGDGINSYTTQFVAGGGGNGTTKAGAGGSVSNLHFFGGGGEGVTFYIDAGDAGNASTAKTGATGGSVTNIGGGSDLASSGDPNFSISTLTDFHHISAGDGGNAATKGGLGGSVTNVHVNAAIGLRTGAPFGFNLSGAGGISAGAGGIGGTTDGAAGNVTNISADAIASIVAGHMNTGDALQASNLATKVDGIILNGNTAPSLVHDFVVTYNNGAVSDTTAAIPSNSSALEVATAINALPNIPPGGVTVVSTTNGYVVTFSQDGSQALMTASEPSPAYTTILVNGDNSTAAVQQLQVLPGDNFTLTYNGETTAQLSAGATATQVATALDALPGFPAGGVTVTSGTGTGGNTSYIVTFNNPGAQTALIVNYSLDVTETVAGNGTTEEVQTLTLPIRGDFDPTQFSTANLVGSVDNLLQTSAATFHYTQLVGGSGFQFGDAPIDGLIAALNLTSNKNFIPEAYVTENSDGSALLVDNLAT